MFPASAKLLISVLVLPYCLAMVNVQYSDLEEMSASCSPRDTCAGGRRKFELSNCECDSQCRKYNDCCVDATVKRSVTPSERYTCVQDAIANRGAYAVSDCRSGWRGPIVVRQRCEVLNDLSDPLVAAPVTDVDKNETYKNRYCAECNDVDPSHIQSWIVQMSCDSLSAQNATGNITANYVNDRLVYKSTYPNRNKWGIYHWDNEYERNVFYPCDLTFSIPNYIVEHVRLCRPKLISTCASSWRQNSYRRKCGAYMAVVYAGKNAYRNPHCAKCNNVDTINCASGVQQRTKPPMSFTLLLDVNLGDGDRVGEINRCSRRQTYDVFFKRCRTLVCAIPGYVLRGDKCSPS